MQTQPSCFCALGRHAARRGKPSQASKPSTKFLCLIYRSYSSLHPGSAYFLFVTRNGFNAILQYVSVWCTPYGGTVSTSVKSTRRQMSLAIQRANGGVNKELFSCCPNYEASNCTQSVRLHSPTRAPTHSLPWLQRANVGRPRAPFASPLKHLVVMPRRKLAVYYYYLRTLYVLWRVNPEVVAFRIAICVVSPNKHANRAL